MALTKISDAALPAGASLQVVQDVYSTYTQITSSSYVDTGISQAITPSSSSNKILVIASIQCSNGSGANANETGFQLVKGSTSIRVYERPIFVWNQGNDNTAVDANISLVFLDSPSTTSATTYKVQAKTSAGTMRVNDYATANGNGCSTLTLVEIAG